LRERGKKCRGKGGILGQTGIIHLSRVRIKLVLVVIVGVITTQQWKKRSILKREGRWTISCGDKEQI
jgi:hypothetical protein